MISLGWAFKVFCSVFFFSLVFFSYCSEVFLEEGICAIAANF